ncbi:MAG: riboflavin biosynthesis protein RibF, partial [Deltaproteobacteria bacterium]|nr:riboflavin biosynthesis protein RibF [Deltaproteobacteria bacterium]
MLTSWFAALIFLGAMRLLYDYRELDDSAGPARAVTIGNFDGVHVGHRAVLEHAVAISRASDLELAVLTFEPHPAELFRAGEVKLRLAEPQRKVELLSECGVDLVLAQKFDEQFAGLTAERFAGDVLMVALRAQLVIVGENFRFGRRRTGDVALLGDLGRQLGFEVRSEPLVGAAGAGVSSSRIRELLSEGEVATAAELLGRLHEVSGRVVRGKGAGHEIGFPTVNLADVRVLAPAKGIYAAHCDVEGQTLKCAAYIGDRPTLGHGATLEAHLIDFDGDLYDQRVRLRFVERLRGERKFD